MKSYPAILHKEGNGFWAEFPDLEGCLAQGDTLEGTLAVAKDVLSSYLQSLDGRKVRINPPSELNGDGIYQIDVDLKIAFAISLRQERERQGLTQAQVAERIGVKWAFYQRIENPRKCNPTLSTIEKVSKAFGKEFLCLAN